jgi:hypothetical protein
MLVSKLLNGVVVVECRSSRRAFRPKFTHRLLLTWLFRNFASLPMSVLTTRQKTLVADIIANGRTIPVPDGDLGTIIGTVESVIPPPGNGKPVASSGGWEFARQSSNHISA